MKHLYTIKWVDLSHTLQDSIISIMFKQFNKPLDHEAYYRFVKTSCTVDLYYENKILEGICISWITPNCRFLYLDKFFSVNFKPGVGKYMLDRFIEKNINKMIRSYDNRSIIWRCNHNVSSFYFKHNKVKKYFNHKINNKDIIYLGVRINKQLWEYEDIYDLNIKSCFQ